MIFKGGPWCFKEVGLVLLLSFEHFNSSYVNKHKQLLWMRLVGLPPHFWSTKILRAISDVLGAFQAFA